jgi:hypothetical protein
LIKYSEQISSDKKRSTHESNIHHHWAKSNRKRAFGIYTFASFSNNSIEKELKCCELQQCFIEVIANRRLYEGVSPAFFFFHLIATYPRALLLLFVKRVQTKRTDDAMNS